MNKYKYKIVLVCPVANWFRGNDLDHVLLKLNELSQTKNPAAWIKIKGPDDEEYCRNLHTSMKNLVDYELRVEHPLINIYTNNTQHLESLSALDASRVKYVSIPNKNNPDLVSNSVIVKKLDFDYKIHMGRTRQEYNNFLKWAENNKKIRLSKKLIRDLGKSSSWGGSYFYVKGESNLTMVRVFLGSDIAKIESVIKA
jgi:hypothetical protein